MRRPPLLALLVLAAASWGLEVPAGEMPRIDGDPSEAAWEAALRLEVPGVATVRLLAADAALCIAVEANGRYRGQRIDLHVSAADGEHYSWHSFHPASPLPKMRVMPIAPVIVRRAAWPTRDRSHQVAPQGCRFRARPHRSASMWSAEIAVGLDAIAYHPRHPMGFRLEIVDPESGRAAVFTPPRSAEPAGWERLVVPWAEGARPFVTLEEDERRDLELTLFQEFLNRALKRKATPAPFGDAVLEHKSNGRVDALLARLDGCIEADPLDYFAHYCRLRLLRHANRLSEAAQAFDAFREQFPYDEGTAARVERRALLLALGRFEDAAQGAGDALKNVLERWREEEKHRLRDQDLPRIRFETTKGEIVVELFATDSPKTVAHLLGIVEKKRLDGAVFDEVTGASHAAATPAEKNTAGPLPEETRLTWRGHVAFHARDANLLVFATGHLLGPSFGRVVEGMDVVDALEAGDKIEACSVSRR